MNKYGIFNNYIKSPQRYGGLTYSKSTNALSSNQNNTINMTIGYNFYISWVKTDYQARIRGYFDEDTRTNDIGRSLNDNINFPNKCIFDFKIKDTFIFYPPLFFINVNNPHNKKLFLTITNLEDSIKIINFTINCLEVSKEEWEILNNVSSPYILSSSKSKILLRDAINLQTDENSLNNYLLYSLQSGASLNSLSLPSLTPIEALVNYQTLNYTIFTKNKSPFLNDSAYILFTDIPSKLTNVLDSSYNSNFLKISSFDYSSLQKSGLFLNNCKNKDSYILSNNVITYLEIIQSSFSISLFSHKFNLTINSSVISVNEESITLPIIIDSSFTDVFTHITTPKDLAVTDTLGNLKQYRVDYFDLTNQLIVLQVIVSLDTSVNTDIVVYLNNSGSISFEASVSGFTWTHYFPLTTETKDLFKSIEPSGTFAVNSDVERGDYIEFNGTSDYLDLQLDTQYFQEFNEYTICMWVKPISLTTTSSNHNISNCLFAQSSSTENDILEIGIDGNSKILEVYQDTVGTDEQEELPTTTTIDLDTWTFIAITYRVNDEILRISINDEIKETTLWKSQFDSTNANITLASNEHTFVYYNGGIQNLLLSNRAISINLFNNINKLINDPINFFNFTGVENN